MATVTTFSRTADRVYEELKGRILSLRAEPGSVVDEAQIVKDTGLSRTPVREAIIRLVSEGLLQRDGRQILVSAFEVGQLRAFFEAMTLLARSVHRMAAVRRREDQLRIIHDALLAFEKVAVTCSELDLNMANHAFHLAVASAADSRFLERAYEEILIESLRLSRQCFAEGENTSALRRVHVDRIVADHRAIYDAIARHDADEADRLVASHSALFRERLARQLLGPSILADNIDLSSPVL